MMRHSRIYERTPETGRGPSRQLTVAQVARRLACSESTVRWNIHSGELAAVRVGKAAWRISEADLNRFLAERSNRADEAWEGS